MIFFRRSATQQFFSSSRACAPVDGHRRPRQRDVHQIYHPGTWAGAGGASVANRVARRTIDILGLFILASAYAYTVRLSRTVCLAIATTKCNCRVADCPVFACFGSHQSYYQCIVLLSKRSRWLRYVWSRVFSDWHITTELLPCLCGKFGIVGFAAIHITIPTVNGAKDGPSHNSNQRGRTLMEPGYTGRSKPSVRLLGSLGNSSLSNQSMVDRHAQAKAFLLNLAQEFAQESKLPLENATILQARLLLHAAVVGKKPLKLCQVVGKRPWINKYMMKHGRFTSEAMDCFFFSNWTTVTSKHLFADRDTLW